MCPKHVWMKALSEGVSLQELGRRGGKKAAANRRKRLNPGYTQLKLFPENRSR